jgi:hypothetical protein
MPGTPEERADFWRKATFWAAGIGLLLTLVAIGVGVWAVLDQRDNTQKIVDALTTENKQLAEQVSKERAEKERLAKISPERLLYEYNLHLSELQKAAEAYEAAKNVPQNREGAAARKAAAERQLYAAVDAFTRFISLWRGVAAVLDKLLDGNVMMLDQARQHMVPDDVQKSIDILRKTFPDLREAFGRQLAIIGNG